MPEVRLRLSASQPCARQPGAVRGVEAGCANQAVEAGDTMIAKCAGKVAYRDEQVAVKASVTMFRRVGDVMQPYHCPTCGAWHIGHTHAGWKWGRRNRAKPRDERT